jgi:regulatory factor X, other
MPNQHAQQQIYQASPEDMLARYARDQFVQNQQFNLDSTLPPQPQTEMTGHDLQQYGIHQPSYQGLPVYGNSQDHMQHALVRTGTFDSMDNQSPAPDDSETAENGQRRKKGSATSLANDAELRRLVHQYQGRSLDDVAAEVQQHEGGGGKSEKAKQVFAMLW